MEHNTALNLSCNFNGYLACQMPANTVEVELKIKMTQGKYTFNKDTCTRMEMYCPWGRVDRRVKVHPKKRRTSRKEVIDIVDSTNSETDIQDGEGFAYAPKVFTNHNYAATIPLTESENSEVELTNKDFIGEYCGECVKKYDRCWCDKSNWDEELMEVEAPKGLTNGPNTKQPNIQRKRNVTVVPIRQPPPSWVEYRRCITKQDTNEHESLREENPIGKLIIKGIRPITTQEFEEM